MLSRMNFLLMVKLICPPTLEPLKFGDSSGKVVQFFNHHGGMWSPNHEDVFIDQMFLGPLVNITGKQNNARF